MSVCANRPEPVGFFTACQKCKCGQEVAAELETDAPAVGLRPNDNGGRVTA